MNLKKRKNLNQIAIKLLRKELKVDLGSSLFSNDISTRKLIQTPKETKASLSSRQKIILCGVNFVKLFFKKHHPNIKFINFYNDGDIINKNSKIAEMNGDIKIILGVERTILNFIQHLSSISTTTYNFCRKLKGSNIKLLDTRKTIIGLRYLQKYATEIGGAKNHRMGLFDKILIKDNHIKICGGLDNIFKVLKRKKITNFMIECDTPLQVKKAITFGSNYILLDNMTKKQILESIKLRGKKKVIFEISGGINSKNIKEFTKFNVDFISTGFITQNPEPIDIGLDIF